MKYTLIDAFENSVSKFASNSFLLEKEGSEWKPLSYADTARKVYALGAGLQQMGVEKGDNIALLSEGRNMWIISELALFYAGGVTVPLSIKLEESNDLLFRLQHGEARYIIVSGTQLRKVRAIIGQLPEVQRVIVLDRQENYEDRECYVGDIMAKGEDYLHEIGKEAFMAVGQSIQNDDLATITYTSGTTADPKGVCLTHRNYTANVEQALSRIPIDDTWRTLIILPLDHCFAHVCGFYLMMMQGATVATVQNGRTPSETLKNIPSNIREVKPHFILSVPALAKSFKKSIETNIRRQGGLVEKLFYTGMKVRQNYYGESSLDSRATRLALRPLVALFDRILFNKVKMSFGGEMRFFVGGGALLDKDLQHFYIGIGLPMFQGYGLSEATPVISTNTPDYYRFGSSGRVLKGVEVRICDADGKEVPLGQEGEIVVRGENVMAGYWKSPEATAETVRDGWLYTGDLGYMTREKLLYVKGRFKSLLISSDGEKYSPEGIEEAIVQLCPAIEQVMLYNNQSPTTSALIVPNKEWLRRNGHDLHSEAGARAALETLMQQLAVFRRGGEHAGMFPERWLPSVIAVLPEPFSEKNRMINSTMKMVRPAIEKAYAERIKNIYTPEGKNLHNIFNLEAIMD